MAAERVSALGGNRAGGLSPGWRSALCALAWLAGLGWQLQQARLWPAQHCEALAGVAGALVVLALCWPRLSSFLPSHRPLPPQLPPQLPLRRSSHPAPLLLLMTAAAASALAMAGLRAGARLAERLPAALEGRNLVVTGVVSSLPQHGPSGLRFQFEVERADWQDGPDKAGRRGGPLADETSRPPQPLSPLRLPPLIALGWYKDFADEVALADPRAGLRAGQRWRLPVRLKLPHGSLNPEGFDVELMWFEQGIGATGYVRVLRGGPPAERLVDAAGYPVQRLREAVREAIARQVTDARSAGVLAALAVGDQAAIEREDWDLFRRTGIAHLVSISGVHITMFAWAAGVLAGGCWRRSSRLTLWRPAPTAGRWLGLGLATAYAVLAGWGVPAQRTVVMLVTVGVLRSQGQRWPWLLVLLAAAVVVTLLDPWALLQPGFWLSFTAVGLLMVSEPASGRTADPPAGTAAVSTPTESLRPRLVLVRWVVDWRTRLGRPLREHLRAQAVATLGLAPLSLVFFQQLSVVGGLANLVAIPLVTLVITPLTLLGVVLPPVWSLAALMVQALVGGLAWLASWPWAVYIAPAAPAWAVAAGLIGALLGVLPAPWALRWLALPLVLPLLWPPVQRPAAGQFDLLAADIGQGTALLVRTRSHLLVYDTGPQYSLDNDAGLRVLLPLLRARGEPRIDLLMLSHRDGDHVGGAASLLVGHPVLALRSSLPAGHALVVQAAGLGVPHRRCEAGQHWDWDGVRFDVLHPTAAEHDAARHANAVSCVLRIADRQGRSALLTGDIEAPQERALLQRQAQGADVPLASDVLLVPHHGSRTSSSEAFIDAVHPRTAVVQAGYRSRYGHPAADVMLRYSDRGIEVVRSDQCGAWLWHDGAGSCTRDVRRRYWQSGAIEGGAIIATIQRP